MHPAKRDISLCVSRGIFFAGILRTAWVHKLRTGPRLVFESFLTEWINRGCCFFHLMFTAPQCSCEHYRITKDWFIISMWSGHRNVHTIHDGVFRRQKLVPLPKSCFTKTVLPEHLTCLLWIQIAVESQNFYWRNRTQVAKKRLMMSNCLINLLLG